VTTKLQRLPFLQYKIETGAESSHSRNKRAAIEAGLMIAEEIVIPVYQREDELGGHIARPPPPPTEHFQRSLSSLVMAGTSSVLMYVLKCAPSDSMLFPLLLKVVHTSLPARIFHVKGN
jgi:hypothetical protein